MPCPRCTPAVLAAALLLAATVVADTGSSLGDRGGEGSTAFTGLAQAPEANLFTGALTTAIPIEVPPGRGSLTPQLALRYVSGAAAGPFGHGWDLPLGRIERSSTWGTPRCGGAHTDDFVLVLPDGTAELVRESPGSAFYRPKVEQAWLRAERRQSENQWRVTDRAGRTYTFGDGDAARVGNSTPPVFMAQDGDGTCRLTAVWALSRVEDAHGNRIDIAWAKVLNTLYPATVRWGANPAAGVAHVYTARLLVEWRPERDRPISHRLGVAQRLVWRVFAIDIESELPAPGTPVRRYMLQYDDDGDGPTSLLAAVGVTGRPTQHFVYTPGAVGHDDPVALPAPVGAHQQLRVANLSQEVSQTVLDMNGDGLLDLVRSDDAPVSSWAVYWGTVDAAGFRFASPATAWQAPGAWLHLRNVVVSGGGCNADGWSCTAADTFDLTGDGIPDRVTAAAGGAWTVHPGGGVPHWGFHAAVNWPAPRPYIRRSRDGDVYQDVVDVNGDGLPDLVDSGAPGEAAPHEWLVYVNTGSGFDPTPLPRFPAPVAAIAERINGGTRHQLLDFNGDGLPDIVRSGTPGMVGAWIDARCQPAANAQASCLEVYLNTGQGFGAMEPPVPVPLSYGVQQTVEDGDVMQDLFDVNGDGLPDWLYRPPAASGGSADEWRVLLNLGGTLEPLVWVTHGVLGAPYTEGVPARVWSGGTGFFREQQNGNTRSDLVDVNGDGFLDHVAAGGAQWSVRLNAAGERPHLLAVMENGLGGTNSIAWRPSTAYDNRGGDAQPDLPAIQWVVAATRQNDGLCTPPPGADPYTAGPAPAANPCIDGGHELVATFQYEGGRFDAATREFRGFRRVVRATSQGSAAPANVTATTFAQDAQASGRLLQVDTYAGSTTLVRREMNLWGTRAAGPGRTQLWLSENRQATYDTGGGGVPHYLATISDPPDAWGNVTHVRREGLAGAARVDTWTTYAVPQSGSQVYDKPAALRVEDAGGVLEERWFHYDGSAGGMALGKVTTGNLKRVRARLTAADANGPETRMQYDAAGNLTRVTDDNGRVTTTAYDAALLYPVSVTNPAGHVTTTAVDYRWGQPLRHVDANGAVTEFAYDEAGRRICTARPGDSLAGCSTTTAWHFASAPGQLSWVEVAARQDGPRPPLWTRHYFDALGRTRYSDALRVVEGAPTAVRSNHVEYDAAGRLRTLYHPYLATAATPDNGVIVQDYALDGGAALDPLGRIQRTINSDGSVRRTRYAGARTLSWDEEAQRTETDVDPHGNAVERRSYADGVLAVTVQQAFDGQGRVRHRWQNGVRVQSYEYDCLGRRTRLDDADSGVWRYGWDGVGNLRWQDDPTPGRHVQTCYDALDRPVRRCAVAGDFGSLQSCSSPTACTDPERVTWGYDAPSVANARGRRSWVEDGSGRTDVLAYDARGRRLDVRKTIEVDGVAGEARFAYAYDANDRVTSITYPDGETVFTVYDDAGQPIALYNAGNTFYVTDARYDLLGRPTLVQHANGVSDRRTWGGPGVQHRLRALHSDAPGGPLLALRYPDYSPRGLLRQVADDLTPSGERSNALGLQYDALGRLTAADSAWDPADRTMAYDAMGNLVRLGAQVMHYGAATRPHQLTAVGSGATTLPIGHDANGNRASKGDTQYAYDSGDRLARVEHGGRTLRVRYDADGRLVARIVDDLTPRVTRVYDRIAEVSDGWQTKTYYLGALRVASVSNSFSAWEQAALGGALVAALTPAGRPALVLLLGPAAQALAGALLLALGAALLAVPGRPRRAAAGVRVRPGHALAVALLWASGTLPWPLAVAPPAAYAGGYAAEGARHYHADHLGSTQVVTSAAGQAIEHIRYLPFGAVRGRWDGGGAALGGPSGIVSRDFAGYQSEPVSGLLDAGARFYDAELGTFLTHDPRGQFASPYSYGGGDPMNWSDPSGEFFLDLIPAIIAGALASAAVNAVIAAAQGAPLGTIGKAALGGAIAGALGAGIGIALAAGSMGASAMAGTLAQNVTLQQAQTALTQVAWRSAFSSTIANAAGQTAAAAGAPPGAVIAVSVVAGYAASYGFDQAFAHDLGGEVVRQGGGQNGAAMCSNTADHTSITGMAAGDAGFTPAQVDEIVAANLNQDLYLANNENHFDYFTQTEARAFRETATRASNETQFLRAAGAASHHVQDQYALGHIFPGTSGLRGPVAAPLRFVVHNAVGGEITFRQASYDATLKLFQELRAASLPRT